MELQVKGMHCRACEELVKDALEDVGAKDIKADWENGKVSFAGDATKAKKAIEEEGYEVRS